MAISKIHPLRGRLINSINYILNPEKTDGEIYVSSYACGIHTADLEFEQTANLGTNRGSIKAQHLIQAFLPGEVDAKTAHEIGKKLAMEVTEGKYEFVLATHVDKNHIHNHIIFNQVDFIEHKKYRGNIYCQRQIAKINDALCASYGLSVISNKANKARPYVVYKDLKTNNSHRQVLKNAIDSCIPLVNSFDELMELLKKLGYEIKISGNNISLKKDDYERFIRLKNLGEKYTYDGLILRIKYNSKNASPYFAKPISELGLLPDLKDRLDKLKSPAYANKVALTEVKRIAATYAFLNNHGISSTSEIVKKQNEWSLSIKENRLAIKELEDKIDSLNDILEALIRKETYNDVYLSYRKSNKSSSFKEKHLTELTLFKSACDILKMNNIAPTLSSSALKDEINELIKKKDLLLDSYHEDVSNLKQLNIASKNIDTILSGNEINNKKIKSKNKNKNI